MPDTPRLTAEEREEARRLATSFKEFRYLFDVSTLRIFRALLDAEAELERANECLLMPDRHMPCGHPVYHGYDLTPLGGSKGTCL